MRLRLLQQQLRRLIPWTPALLLLEHNCTFALLLVRLLGAALLCARCRCPLLGPLHRHEMLLGVLLYRVLLCYPFPLLLRPLLRCMLLRRFLRCLLLFRPSLTC